MLGGGIEQLPKSVVLGEGGVQIRKQNQDCQNAQNENIQLFAEKHAEYRLPIGVPRRGDLFRLQFAVVVEGEQLLLRHAQFTQIMIHSSHLSFVENEIRGSTVAMRISPRIRDTTDSNA